MQRFAPRKFREARRPAGRSAKGMKTDRKNKTQIGPRPVALDTAAGRALMKSWSADLRLCATDVDGTITMEDAAAPAHVRGCLHPAAYEQIRRLAAAGVRVALVTGRPLPSAEGLALYLGLTDRNRTESGHPIVAENGAVVKMNGKVTRLARAPRRRALAAARAMLEAKPFKGACELTFDNMHRICDVGVHTPPELLPQVRAYFERRPELGLQAVTSNIMSHVVCARASKARALNWVLERMDLDLRNVIVFGDSDTDIPLFEAFERSVAVSNYFDGARARELPAAAAPLPGGAGFAAACRLLAV